MGQSSFVTSVKTPNSCAASDCTGLSLLTRRLKTDSFPKFNTWRSHNMVRSVALITGCSDGGIGHALCVELARRPNWHVYASARRLESLVGLAELGCTCLGARQFSLRRLWLKAHLKKCST